MGTTIDNTVQNRDAWRNKTLANKKVAESPGKSPEQSGLQKKATKAGESQVRDLDTSNDPKDIVEIQHLRHQVIEANRASLENRIKDVDEAQELLEKTIGLVNSENEISRVALVHDLSQVQVHLLELLS